MNLKIKEAIALCNARQEAANKKAGDPVSKGKITVQHIGELLYPGSSYASYGVSMGKIMKGKMKKFNPEWVIIICGRCDVDPNFLYAFGFSEFNSEYNLFFPTEN